LFFPMKLDLNHAEHGIETVVLTLPCINWKHNFILCWYNVCLFIIFRET